MTTWTYDMEERLKAMWAEGKTALQISKELGVTRSGVCGKARRLGCDARENRVLPTEQRFERAVALIAEEDEDLHIAAKRAGMSWLRFRSMWRDLAANLGERA